MVLDNYTIGKTDRNGNLITKIFSRGDSFVVYEIESNIQSDSLRVIINPEDKKEFVQFENNYEQIKQEVNEIKAIIYKAKRENSLKHLIAPAISKGITGDIEGAKQMLKTLKKTIDNQYIKQFNDKILYLCSNLFFVFLLILISYLTYCGYISWCCEKNEIIKLFIYCITTASMGGFISLALKLKKIEIDFELPMTNIIFYGIERMVISILSGILLVVIIKSDLILSIINQSDNPFWGYMTFSAIAGFSENYIPDILSKIEKEN